MSWNTSPAVDFGQTLATLLNHLRNRCEACVARGENSSPVDLNVPLACPCRCAAMAPVIDQAISLQSQLANG